MKWLKALAYGFAILVSLTEPAFAQRFAQTQIVTSGDMSAAAGINSNAIDLQQGSLAAIQAVWTGATAIGTASLQISNDNVAVPAAGSANPGVNVVNWSTYTGSTTSISGAGNFLWNLNNVGYRWLRLNYTSSSGAGTLNAILTYKGD